MQSRPNYWVTANLWVPNGAGPFPGIVSPCGHYDISRFYPDYQCACRGMVASGFVVLVYDPAGQGERRHFWDPATSLTPDQIAATTEHSLAGHALRLLGEDVNQYFVWDGMRVVDYLLTRPEVDPARIGCAGHSGGGTQAMYLVVADPRIACAAIHEGGLGHQWLDPARPLQPSDCEQNLFGAAIFGLDSAELHAAIAPRPLLVTIENFNPYFDTAAADVRLRYERLGVPERFAVAEAQAPHAWTAKLRIANTDWLCRHFYQRPGPATEPACEPEQQETLRTVENGSLRHSGYQTIFTRLRSEVEALRTPPPRDLPAELRRLLRYRTPGAPQVREAGEGRIVIDAGDGVELPVMVQGQGSPLVYLDPEGAQAAAQSGLLAAMARAGRTVVAVDVRGVGATRPPSSPRRRGPFSHISDAETWMSYSAWQLDDSLLGLRVADAVRAIAYAASLPAGARGVRVVGTGMGALWALLAAALDRRVASVVAHQGLLSWATMAAADRCLHGANVVIPAVLRHFDLPDVAASVAPRPVTLVAPVDAMQQPVDLAHARRVYRRAAGARFRILRASTDIAGIYAAG